MPELPNHLPLNRYRTAAPTRSQPQRVMAEAAKLAKEISMHRGLSNQPRDQYEAFVSAELKA